MAYRMTDIEASGRNNRQIENGVNVPARWLQFNEGSWQVRLRDAWLVWRGKAQAVIWK